jgi:DNA-binding CsgD family transcriptional regulator
VAEIWKITHTRLGPAFDPLYERLLGSLGNGDLGGAVRDCVEALTAGARRIYLFEATSPVEDALRYYHCEPRIVGLLPAYAEQYKRLDPIREIYGNAIRPGTMALQRIKPSDIRSVAFRRRFFDEAGIVERVSIVQRGKDRWRGMNLARHSSEGTFSDRELDNVVGLARLALPMLPVSLSHVASTAVLSAAQLEERFGIRCASLTRRERQVCARAALGMSVEATAIELGIAKTSVVTFRQRAYRRLGVTSPYELLGLVAH